MEPMTGTTGIRHLEATRMHPNDSNKGVRPLGSKSARFGDRVSEGSG